MSFADVISSATAAELKVEIQTLVVKLNEVVRAHNTVCDLHNALLARFNALVVTYNQHDHATSRDEYGEANQWSGTATPPFNEAPQEGT